MQIFGNAIISVSCGPSARPSSSSASRLVRFSETTLKGIEVSFFLLFRRFMQEFEERGWDDVAEVKRKKRIARSLDLSLVLAFSSSGQGEHVPRSKVASSHSNEFPILFTAHRPFKRSNEGLPSSFLL